MDRDLKLIDQVTATVQRACERSIEVADRHKSTARGITVPVLGTYSLDVIGQLEVAAQETLHSLHTINVGEQVRVA